jgi:RNA polymerase binding protein RbpA
MRTAKTSGVRATRVGGGPAGEPDNGGFTVAKVVVLYDCANGHRTTVPFISTVTVPPQWECRVCSEPAGTIPTDPPAPDSSGVAGYLGGKSHLGHVKSRRSPAEGDALMAESLARRDHPERFNIWGKFGRRKSLGGFGGDLAVTVQRRRVGGGPAGIPAF